MGQLVKNPPAMWETWVRSLGWEDPPEKEKATTPVFWPGEFHGLYSPWGRKESDVNERLSLHYHYQISIVAPKMVASLYKDSSGYYVSSVFFSLELCLFIFKIIVITFGLS